MWFPRAYAKVKKCHCFLTIKKSSPCNRTVSFVKFDLATRGQVLLDYDHAVRLQALSEIKPRVLIQF